MTQRKLINVAGIMFPQMETNCEFAGICDDDKMFKLATDRCFAKPGRAMFESVEQRNYFVVIDVDKAFHKALQFFGSPKWRLWVENPI